MCRLDLSSRPDTVPRREITDGKHDAAKSLRCKIASPDCNRFGLGVVRLCTFHLQASRQLDGNTGLTETWAQARTPSFVAVVALVCIPDRWQADTDVQLIQRVHKIRRGGVKLVRLVYLLHLCRNKVIALLHRRVGLVDNVVEGLAVSLGSGCGERERNQSDTWKRRGKQTTAPAQHGTAAQRRPRLLGGGTHLVSWRRSAAHRGRAQH